MINQKYELMLNTLITGDIEIFARLFKGKEVKVTQGNVPYMILNLSV